MVKVVVVLVSLNGCGGGNGCGDGNGGGGVDERLLGACELCCEGLGHTNDARIHSRGVRCRL